MAMGSMPVPEHQVPVEEQLRIMWPSRVETPEAAVIEGREVKDPALETREEK